MTVKEFQEQIKAGIPDVLPAPKPYDPTINHAPKRKEILTEEERVLAIRNALRYFPAKHHEVLAREFAEELHKYGRIYMYRFRPDYEMYARPIEEYPHKSRQAAAIMVMIQNNLDKAVAQHPHELITYGGNGAVFQNWAQYLLTMQYLSQMTDDQTLVMYSGHPMGLFPSHPDAPRVIVTNGMVIPNYSKPDDWERFNALGVLNKLEAMTAVCSVGLDMIVIPGDTTADIISGIIADEAAIGMVNSKTTAVRLIPAIGKKAGEELDFGGLLGKGPIMEVNRNYPSTFINRGGRIPAPLQSLKN